ncbi:MAG: hypothetical protein WED10_13320 [Brumimicrobium sp.]
MHLALTFDYELFGDGTGDVFEHMIKPTDEILRICESHGIKTTLFFEVLEYLKLKEEWEKGNTMGYSNNPITAIEEQVHHAAQNGHDVQLHLHPQWVHAKWTGNKWRLDMGNWRLGDFSSTRYSIEELLAASKQAVEQLVRKVQPDYECTILRAGAYNIMPSDEVYKAMKKVGLQADSSVYPGGYENGRLSKYDYRSVPLNKDYWWAAPKDIRKSLAEHKDIMEIPVFALPQRRIHKLLNRDKLASLVFGGKRKISSVAKEKMSKRSFIEKLRFLFGKEAFTWDFCLFSPYLHRKFFSYIERHLIGQRNTFVIIGHPKSYQSDRSLTALIKQAKKRKYTFKTLKEVHETFSH